jgi:hypothetical protein
MRDLTWRWSMGHIDPPTGTRYGIPVDDPADQPSGEGQPDLFDPCPRCGKYFWPIDTCPGCGDED